MSTNGINGTNGTNGHSELSARAQELEQLINTVTSQLLPWISRADNSHTLLDSTTVTPPHDLAQTLHLGLSATTPAGGRDALTSALHKILHHSINTWSPGFMDKLYSTTTPIGVASELLTAALNTNVHVYQVSPALSVIEREATRAFASLVGFAGDWRGGVTLPGGSASNAHSMVIARNTLFPETKEEGNGGRRFCVFTSVHGHYSVEKAAVMLGIGRKGVWSVGVDGCGRMKVAELEEKVRRAKAEGWTPFYVNAGAGSTVLGSYDPFEEIAEVCRRHNLWFHVDGSWGGSVVFSERERWRAAGVEKADSFTVNPHKMLGVPVTCSFLLTNDRRRFARATSLKAGYLFHEVEGAAEDDVWDLAQMTMGCGRRADSLKMALTWVYHGKEGFEKKINNAFDMAAYFADQLKTKSNFHLVSENPPPCLQVCFYYIGNAGKLSDDAAVNTKFTRRVAHQLLEKGFMIDYSPDPVHGEFFRAVVNGNTTKETVDRLIESIESLS